LLVKQHERQTHWIRAKLIGSTNLHPHGAAPPDHCAIIKLSVCVDTKALNPKRGAWARKLIKIENLPKSDNRIELSG
jgi:hypothetical protein